MQAKLLLILLAVAIATGSMTACKKKKRRRPSHGEGVHGCRYDDEEIEQTCSGSNPRPRTVLDVPGPPPNVDSLVSTQAHPAKAGAAKPRNLRFPRATDLMLRGTTKIAELALASSAIALRRSRISRDEVRYGSTCHCPLPSLSAQGADGTGEGPAWPGDQGRPARHRSDRPATARDWFPARDKGKGEVFFCTMGPIRLRKVAIEGDGVRCRRTLSSKAWRSLSGSPRPAQRAGPVKWGPAAHRGRRDAGGTRDQRKRAESGSDLTFI